MPDCQLGLNDRIAMEASGKGGGGAGAAAGKSLVRSGLKDTQAGGQQIEMDDLTFHQCVKLHKFETDRSISFCPPDGAPPLAIRLATRTGARTINPTF